MLLKCVNSYASSFPGSQLWRVSSTECEKLFKSWNVLVRQVFGVDRRTHRALIEPISDALHLKTMLCSRFVKFVLKALDCNKFTVRFLANLFLTDNRTTLGSNMAYIAKECETVVNKLTPSIVKRKLIYRKTEYDWKTDVAMEMLEVRHGNMSLEGFSKKEIEEILTNVCIY